MCNGLWSSFPAISFWADHIEFIIVQIILNSFSIAFLNNVVVINYYYSLLKKEKPCGVIYKFSDKL
jgi:hypothetical protein